MASRTDSEIHAAADAASDADDGANAVLLAGRLAGPAVLRDMPSGSSLLQFRLIVRRSCTHGRRDPRSPTVDTIDCVSWNPSLLGNWAHWRAGDAVSLAGCLRRRFWRAGAGVASRYEVDVHQVTWSPASISAETSMPAEPTEGQPVDRAGAAPSRLSVV